MSSSSSNQPSSSSSQFNPGSSSSSSSLSSHSGSSSSSSSSYFSSSSSSISSSSSNPQSSSSSSSSSDFTVSIEGLPANNKSVIGLKNTFTAALDPADLEGANFQWTITGFKCKSSTLNTATFTSIPAQATTTNLQAADLQTQTVSFYWIKPTTATVKVSVTANGVTKESEVTIEVVEPQNVSFTNVQQVPANKITLTQNELIYADASTNPDTEGIAWTANLTAPTDFDGRMGIMQGIKARRVNIKENNYAGSSLDQHRRQEFEATVMLLDRKGGNTTPMYGNLNTVVPKGTTKSLTDGDSPAVDLESNLAEAGAEDSFETIIVWRPDGDESIWLGVRKLKWGWAAAAVQDDSDCDDERDVWIFIHSQSIQQAVETNFVGTLQWPHHHQTEYDDKYTTNPPSIYWDLGSWEPGVHDAGWCP